MPATFIHEDFLLGSKAARRIYHKYAAEEPIFDYHCHIPPKDIAENRSFRNLFEIWLEGDHYKWRAMRSNGVPEKFVTGSASPEEKFRAWAETVPHTLRNPLYHWTHLELKRYFGITDLLDAKSATKVWKKANAMLATPEFSTQGILKKMNVRVVCTTDDPVDSLEHHKAFAKQGHPTRMLPAFRPDKALSVDQPKAFNAWTDRLAEVSGKSTGSFSSFLEAIDDRHAFFHSQGCRLSDHGMDHCFADFCTEKEAAAVFSKARAGKAVSTQEHARYASFLMLYFGHLDAKRGWTKQLHLGALRNNNARLLGSLGPDTGFDSIGDDSQARTLAAYLNRLDSENLLPKTVIYNLNPADNYVFATMIGNFQDGTVPGKIQYGSGWWFLDQKEGMEWQMNALSSLGLLSRFIGMITDSRSFMSYPRHEYFRRTLCNLIGRDIEQGLIPDDDGLVGPMIRNICYANARDYMNFPGVSDAPVKKKASKARR
jgi:glucuronate isomerase